MNFKFFKGKDNLFLELEPTQLLSITRQTFDNVEFCFQFDDNDPIVFATGSNECTLRLNNTSEGYITFSDQNNRFKLFAREGRND